MISTPRTSVPLSISQKLRLFGLAPTLHNAVSGPHHWWQARPPHYRFLQRRPYPRARGHQARHSCASDRLGRRLDRHGGPSAEIPGRHYAAYPTEKCISVPEIYAWDVTSNNENGAPYVCMGLLPGKRVSEVWFDDSGSTPREEMRLRILTSLSKTMADFLDLNSISSALLWKTRRPDP